MLDAAQPGRQAGRQAGRTCVQCIWPCFALPSSGLVKIEMFVDLDSAEEQVSLEVGFRIPHFCDCEVEGREAADRLRKQLTSHVILKVEIFYLHKIYLMSRNLPQKVAISK